jgi:hypothetical protein
LTRYKLRAKEWGLREGAVSPGLCVSLAVEIKRSR